MATPDQAVFGKYVLFNLASVVGWQVVTAANQRQVDIDNVRENTRKFTHDYKIGDQLYVKMSGIYRKLDYKKQGPYIITEVFPNVTVRVQWGQVNKQLNIGRLKPHFEE